MPNPLKKLIIVSALGLAIGGILAQFTSSPGARQPASAFPPPKPKLWAHSPHGKLSQSMNVKITAVGGVPNEDEQELRLRAEVTLNRPIDQEVKFQWVLPPDASLVSGEIEDAWPNLQTGQTATAEIVILGVSKRSAFKTVSLHVSGVSGGVQYASSGSFATNSLEKMTAEAEKMGVRKVQSSELVLKNQDSAGRIKRIHQ